MDIKDLYTSSEEAKIELKRRWEDKELEKKVSEYLKGNIPEILKAEPRAISTSHVASPHWAFYHFWKEAEKMKLKTLAFEYLEDTFVTTNFDKASLAKMVFYHGRNDQGAMILSNEKIIDLTGKEENKRICDIQTTWGENLVDFHHRALDTFYGEIDMFDASSWYKSMGKNAKEYYKYAMAIFIRNGILFENFLVTKSEEKFTREILLPAFEEVSKYFGLKPLIVPIAPKNEEDNKYWWCYPEFIKMTINGIVYKKSYGKRTVSKSKI
ncbi:hypothetical protein EPO17_01800 [Patescibacteria group bacterium]|nr:MAG: hypothetical protein EPO17_01800 [Patescibacteria group bacterium]